jgi:hypothetical protein
MAAGDYEGCETGLQKMHIAQAWSGGWDWSGGARNLGYPGRGQGSLNEESDQLTWFAGRRGKARIGGILIILAALVALGDASFTVLAMYISAEDGAIEEWIAWTVIPFEVFRMALVTAAVAGGVSAVMQVRWRLAMRGGVLGVVAVISSLYALFNPLWGIILLLPLIGGIAGAAMMRDLRYEFKVPCQRPGPSKPMHDEAAER